jgi:hypothetical protein
MGAHAWQQAARRQGLDGEHGESYTLSDRSIFGDLELVAGGEVPNDLPRLSTIEAEILELLAVRRPMYGLELVEASDGRLKRGTVYVTLARMERKGYVRSEQEAKAPTAIGLPRRMYRIAPLGARVRDAWALVRRALALEGA